MDILKYYLGIIYYNIFPNYLAQGMSRKKLFNKKINK